MLKKTFKILSVLIIIILAGLAISSSQTKPTPVNADVQITDQNNDGIINLVDARIATPPTSTSCVVCVDVNGDKIINDDDVNLVNDKIPPESPGENEAPIRFNPRFDVNSDNAITAADADIVQNYQGQTVQPGELGMADPSELTFGFTTKDIIISYKTETTESQKQSLINKYNLKQIDTYDFFNAASLESSQVNVENLQKQIATEPQIQYADKNHIGELASNDEFWGLQWQLNATRVPQTWFTDTIGANRVNVAVIDTGIDITHYDLQHNLSPSRFNALSKIGFGTPTDVTDVDGHGTLVSGIIGATVNNNAGIAGINWNVQIVPIRACLYQCDRTATLAALQWIIQQRDIRVVNISICFGYNSGYSTSNSAIDTAYNRGINFIAGAGQDRRDDACWPANHPKVTSVGASFGPDGDTWASSNRGYDVKAPGVSVLSTFPIQLDTDGNGVRYDSGTSFSSAHVTGVAALCRAVAAKNSQKRLAINCANPNKDANSVIDAWATVWYRNCHRFDFNNNGFVGIGDGQTLAFRVNAPSWYNSKYDVWPVAGDGQINNNDILAWFKMSGLFCQT